MLDDAVCGVEPGECGWGVAAAATKPMRMAPGTPAPVPWAKAPTVTPTKAGRANTAKVNSSQHSAPMAASEARIARMIMVVASVR